MVKRRKRREKATRMADDRPAVAVHDPKAGSSKLERIPALQQE
jgi:hypothetical protein